MFEFDYKEALYRKNNYGQPCVWYACENIINSTIQVYHGIVGKTITKEIYRTHRNLRDEVQSRINAKRKSGYKYLNEIRDDFTPPVKETLLTYLTTYLPDIRTTSDGSTLAMLAKSFDKTSNPFKSVDYYLGQYKINGLRCFIRAVKKDAMFANIELTFQSREGTYWNSLKSLEEYLLRVIPDDLLEKMIYEHYVLDGELYIPGYSINEINSAVKTETNPLNKLVQYWCYDIAIEEMSARQRSNLREQYFKNYQKSFRFTYEHISNKERLISLNSEIIVDKNDINSDRSMAAIIRDKYISLGFEGLILRNPNSEYQFGKRNMAMLKYKKATDGVFEIVDIYPEGNKRENLPLFKCKNDINDECFEVHINGTFEYQQECLRNKDNLIGKKLFITFGERSGVSQLPFHCKQVVLYQ